MERSSAFFGLAHWPPDRAEGAWQRRRGRNTLHLPWKCAVKNHHANIKVFCIEVEARGKRDDSELPVFGQEGVSEDAPWEEV